MVLVRVRGAGAFSAPAGPAQGPTGRGVGSPGSRFLPPAAGSGQPGGSVQESKATSGYF